MANDRLKTGIAGLDDVLAGGLPADRVYLLTGEPGTGKTTLSLQFLQEGARNGEKSVYITLSETAEELRAAAASHGWTLDGVTLIELMPSAEALAPDEQYTIFHPSEVELGETVKRVIDVVTRVEPARLVFDSLSELRLLAHDGLRYRRQILALKQFFVGRRCTVLLLDDRSAKQDEVQLESVCHGVLRLERVIQHYGGARRRLQVAKLRGLQFREGYHDFVIARGGLVVFPRLIAAEHQEPVEVAIVPSGVAALDQLLGGGIDAGTSTLLMGPAGAGKSTIAQQYATSAAARGQRAVLFLFEESRETALRRADGLGMPLRALVESGRIGVRQIDPAELSPGEFTHAVRHCVEAEGVRMIVIDSLNGYLHAMPEERLLIVQLHELLTYLGQRSVATFLIVSQEGLLGHMSSPVDITYLADTVILLRFFEAMGAVRQAISVVKKRSGPHERTIHELTLRGGVQIGETLRRFAGVLSGIPTRTADS